MKSEDDGNLPDFNRIWDRLDQEAIAAKSSHQVLANLKKIYLASTSETRRAAEQTFAEWLDSINPRKRFDALALIDEFSISAAESKLRELVSRLSAQISPEARFELRWANSILAEFEERTAKSMGSESMGSDSIDRSK